MARSKRCLNCIRMAGWLADCLAGCSGGWSLLTGWLAKVSDGWPAACMPARLPSAPCRLGAVMRVCPSQRETASEGATHGSEKRLAGRLTAHVLVWLDEPLLGWLPFCWLVGGLAPDRMFAAGHPDVSELPASACSVGRLPACLPTLLRIRCRLACLPCRVSRFRDDQKRKRGGNKEE